MTNDSAKQIAILSDNKTCLRHLREAIEEMGYEIGHCSEPDDGVMPAPELFSIWLIYLSDEDKWADLVDGLLEQDDSPILFGVTELPSPSSTDFLRWKRKLLEKISSQIGPPECIDQVATSLPNIAKIHHDAAPNLAPPANEELDQFQAACNDDVNRVWVLGASLGGPTAIKEFLDALPEGLPVSFILAQHIDKGFQKVLIQVLGRHSTFELSKETIGAQIEYGKVYIAPVETVFDIKEGLFIAKDLPWQAPYAPSIDQVIDITSRYYGARCGSIIFSGMGCDGAIAGPEQVKRGGRVWAQTADSCANSSMPDSVRETGCVTFNGSPKHLAQQLIVIINKERKETEAETETETRPSQEAAE